MIHFTKITIAIFSLSLTIWSCRSNTPNDSKTTTIPVDTATTVVKDSVMIPIEAFAQTVTKKVRRGDNFNDIMSSNGVKRGDINTLNNQLKIIFDLRLFKIGQSYQLNYKEDSQVPSSIEYDIDERSSLVIDVDHTNVEIVEKEIVTQRVVLTRKITNSLEGSLTGLPTPGILATKILTVFAWQLDFGNLKKEDHFTMIYEEELIDSVAIGIGNLLAIHFTHDGERHQGYWFDNGSGGEYFDKNGVNLSFAPLRCDMVTSLYSKRRLHPVRRTYRAHLGMDFKAEIGTPVFALKDGLITQSGYRKANGNCVRIKHTGKDQLSTMYLHLDKIAEGVVAGDSVKQSQLIGYVGTTGLSSAPHLCLRVFQNGKQKDPLNYDFPRRTDVLPEHMEAFKKYVIAAQQQLKPI